MQSFEQRKQSLVAQPDQSVDPFDDLYALTEADIFGLEEEEISVGEDADVEMME